MGTKFQTSTALSRGSNFGGVQLRVDYVSPELLKPPSRQVRRRTREQTERIARSMNDFGCLVPIIVDSEMRIVAGLGRWEAAKLLGLTTLPIIRVEHLTEAQLRLFSIADNKLPEGVRWLKDELLLEFAEIEILQPEVDLSSSGFQIAEIDTLYGQHRHTDVCGLDEPEELADGEPTNRVGDTWALGKDKRHRLGCGDARDGVFISTLLGERQARIVLCDPPWNLKIEGVVSGNGRVKHRDFVMAAGELSKEEFTAFLGDFLCVAQQHLVDGALLYVFMDWRNLDALSAAAFGCGLEQKNLLVWCKDNAGQGSMYRSRHELVGLYKHGKAPHLNNIAMGRHGRNRSNVLFYPGVNSFSSGRKAALESHPTCKPASMLADIILDTSAPDDLILDPFGGSGSTMIAAEVTNRTSYLVELDPRYADSIIKRVEQHTGEPAIHLATGCTFAEVTAERASQSEEATDGE